jgi:hypothetical protein
MIVMTILCTIIWQKFITDTLYHCTDAIWLDYFFPGTWVHDPVSVTQVVRNRPMSEPDTIKAGWTVAGLWTLWYAFAGVSLLVSFLAALVPWVSKRWSR